MAEENKKKLQLRMPDAYVFLFMILVLAAVATYILPAGAYDREEVDGITRIIDGSYTTVESSPIGLVDFFLSLQIGYVNTASIIFMIIFTGAALKIVEETGAIKAGIYSAVRLTKGNPYFLVSLLVILFSLSGGIGVLSTQVIPFVLIGLLLCRAIKLDALVSVAITFGACFVGWSASFINPFTVGIAQTIAEVPLFSGVTVRFLLFSLFTLIYLGIVLFYVRTVLKSPNKSLSGILEPDDSYKEQLKTKFTLTQKIVLIFSLFVIAFYAYAVLNMGWGIDHMSAIVLIIAIGTALIARMEPDDFIKNFMSGASGIVYGAFVVGISNAIIVVLEEGLIIDTIVFGLSEFMQILPYGLAATGMLITNSLLNFFIPSGSGQAFVVMPIMTPIADMVDVTRQTAIQSYQLGDGFSSMIFPTSGPLMASLSVAGLAYGTWLRWMFPIFILFMVISIVVMILGTYLEWGPL